MGLFSNLGTPILNDMILESNDPNSTQPYSLKTTSRTLFVVGAKTAEGDEREGDGEAIAMQRVNNENGKQVMKMTARPRNKEKKSEKRTKTKAKQKTNEMDAKNRKKQRQHGEKQR
jgi:hypothetical protein